MSQDILLNMVLDWGRFVGDRSSRKTSYPQPSAMLTDTQIRATKPGEKPVRL